MDINEIKALSLEELREKLTAANKQLMEFNFKRHTGLEKPHMFKLIRRDVARMLTVAKEKKWAL